MFSQILQLKLSQISLKEWVNQSKNIIVMILDQIVSFNKKK